jgi:hypothetical protein
MNKSRIFNIIKRFFFFFFFLKCKSGMNVVNVVCHAEGGQRHLMGEEEDGREGGEGAWLASTPV